MAPAYADTPFPSGYEFTQGSGYPLPEYPFRRAARDRHWRGEPPPDRHRRRRAGRPDPGLPLARYGVPAVLLDEDNTVGAKGASSRGICYTQKSLEIFERLGVYERIAAKGIQWSVGRTFAGQTRSIPSTCASKAATTSSQPPFINIQQFYIEGFLVERIAELGHVDLRWRNRVIGFEQNSECATLTIATPAGEYRMRADHVIDASGAHSPFRSWVGASVTARKGDDRWCIADVRFSKHPPVSATPGSRRPSTRAAPSGST